METKVNNILKKVDKAKNKDLILYYETFCEFVSIIYVVFQKYAINKPNQLHYCMNLLVYHFTTLINKYNILLKNDIQNEMVAEKDFIDVYFLIESMDDLMESFKAITNIQYHKSSQILQEIPEISNQLKKYLDCKPKTIVSRMLPEFVCPLLENLELKIQAQNVWYESCGVVNKNEYNSTVIINRPSSIQTLLRYLDYQNNLLNYRAEILNEQPFKLELVNKPNNNIIELQYESMTNEIINRNDDIPFLYPLNIRIRCFVLKLVLLNWNETVTTKYFNIYMSCPTQQKNK
jgi:hypothetical protein